MCIKKTIQMSFCDEPFQAPPMPRSRHVATSYRVVSKTNANDDFASLSDASLAAKKGAVRAFTESSTPYDAATSYLEILNRLLTRTLKQKTTNDDIKIALDGIDAIETNGVSSLVKAKNAMRDAVERWMMKHEYNPNSLHEPYNAHQSHRSIAL